MGKKQVSALRSFVSMSGTAAHNSRPERATNTRSGCPGAKFSIHARSHSWRSIGSSRGPLASAWFHSFSSAQNASRPSRISTVKPCGCRSLATARAMAFL